MDDLTRYAAIFDESYPEYSDARYSEIQTLVSRYAQESALATVQCQQFMQLVELLQPLVAIKNYKSQVPFPETLQDALACCIQIKQSKVGRPALSDHLEMLFKKLIGSQGFQLPTVSAVFHFCHPQAFPIVDRNVEAACAFLKKRYPRDFIGVEIPKLPDANTLAANKLRKYREFVVFIDRIVSLQRAHGGNPNYRFVDKALMVLGSEGGTSLRGNSLHVQ